MKIIDFLRYAIDGRRVKGLLIMCQVLVLSVLIGCRVQLGSDVERFERERSQLISAHEAEMDELKAQAEAGIYITGYLPVAHENEIRLTAKWLGCIKDRFPGLSFEALSLAPWVLFNRYDSEQYPDDLEMVLIQEGQFEEFDPEHEITDELWAIAANQVARWKAGDTRPCGSGAVFIKISSEGVELRDKWDENSQCNRWAA